MDAVTAVSGSGPAYFALLAEAMIEAGLLLGLSREISTQLVVQTMLGTAKQLRDEKMHPVELREMVTSPGGTTIAAIRELESAGVRAAFLNAIQAAMTRAKELATSKTRARFIPLPMTRDSGSRAEESGSSVAARARERIQHEHRVRDRDVLEERLPLLERAQHVTARLRELLSSRRASAPSATPTAAGSSPSETIREASGAASSSRPRTSSASAAQ